MPAILASAPGKVILFGEHTVVYHRPAVAVPVTQVKVKASILPGINLPPGKVQIEAPDIDLSVALDELDPGHPLSLAVRNVFRELSIARPPAFILRITSTIPIAAGMGSGAAVTIAICRAVSSFLGSPLPDAVVSRLAYEVEQVYHGNPSGIDNTVITYAQPVYYVRDQTPELLKVRRPFTLVIGDTGIQSPTGLAVRGVRERWEQDPGGYEALFDRIATVTRQACQAIETGDLPALGRLMDGNQALLQAIGVSSVELEALVAAARGAGAQGAKLTGAGAGGNMIALASPETAPAVAQALERAGATRTIISQVEPSKS